MPWLVRGTNTQPICLVTIEIATYEEDRVGMSGSKLDHVDWREMYSRLSHHCQDSIMHRQTRGVSGGEVAARGTPVGWEV